MNSRTKKIILASAGVSMASWLLLRRSTRFTFKGRTVLISGGSRGLGLVLARMLLRAGARVAILARDETDLRRARVDLAQYGDSLLARQCDITKADDIQSAVTQVIIDFGAIDVLINNAGIIQVGPISRMTKADFEQTLAINFWGAFNLTEAVLPSMRERKSGRIINISSVGGKISVPHMVPYSVSKFALVAYSNGLRAELANQGIIVTTVCPGLMRTGSPRNADFKGQHTSEYAWFKISDSLPFLSMSAENAARQIMCACRDGKAEVILSLPAKLAVAFHQLFPEWSANLISLANRLMPRPGNNGTDTFKGKDSETIWSRNPLTNLSDNAAVRNNEMEEIQPNRYSL